MSTLETGLASAHAQMSVRNGRWRLYVALMGVVGSRWPEHRWHHRATAVPTPAEREQVLASLGYKPVPGARWEWEESSETPDDPSSPVRLYATTTVRALSQVLAGVEA